MLIKEGKGLTFEIRFLVDSRTCMALPIFKMDFGEKEGFHLILEVTKNVVKLSFEEKKLLLYPNWTPCNK